MSALKLVILMMTILSLVACHKEGGESAPVVAQQEKASLLQEDAASAPVRNVIVRRPRVLINSLAKILVVDKSGMCMEMGELPCRLIHSVSLGGVDAYNHSQYTYREDAPVTAPISLERIVLSACMQRASLDFINPSTAVIFKNLDLSVDGRLVDNAKVDEAIQRLYQRSLMRHAVATEVAALKSFYKDIYDENPRGAALNWMTLSCFTVLTSIEGVFY